MVSNIRQLVLFSAFTSITALVGCGEKAATCGVSLQESSLFASSANALSGDLEAAREAGLAAEGAHQKDVIFAQKIATIAKDPKLSEQWASVVKVDPGGARTSAKNTGVAIDLPLQASRLRAAGVPADEVSKAIDAATSADLTVNETASLLAVSANAATEAGPIDGFSSWTAEQVKLGLRGRALENAVLDEHKIRGQKSLKTDAASDKKSTVCHRPPGNPNNAKTLEVGPSALSAHLGHGDTQGACPDGTGKEGGPGNGDAKGNSDAKGNADPKGNGDAKGNADPKGNAGAKSNGNAKGKK